MASKKRQHPLINLGLIGRCSSLAIDLDCARLNISNCGSSRGVEVFQSQQSLGFQRNASSTWKEIGIYQTGLGSRYGLTGNAYFGYDSGGPSTAASVNVSTLDNLAIAAFASTDIWLGQLGLSMFAINISDTQSPHSFLSRLKEAGNIPSLSFGFQAGAPYRFTKVPGSLVLGGYDRSRIGNNNLQIPATEDTYVGLQKMTATFGNGTVLTLLNQGILTLIDTNVPELWLPPSVCDTIAASLGLTYYNASDRYVLTDATLSSLQNLSPTFTFQIGTSASGGSTINIEIPYAAFNLQATYPIFSSGVVNYFPIRRAASDTQYALGRAFLQEVYMTVDWERDVFNISQAVFTSPPPQADLVVIQPKDQSLVNTSDKKHHKGSGSLSGGAIAGIIIGSLLFLVLLVVAAWRFRRRRNLKKKYAAEQATLAAAADDKKKSPADFAPEAVEHGREPPLVIPQDRKTDLELEGRPVPEMYSPHHHHESLPHAELGDGRPNEIYELPSPGPEMGPER